MSFIKYIADENHYKEVLSLVRKAKLLKKGVEVRPQVTMKSAEAFVFYVSRRWQQEFGKVKVWFDCSLVVLATVFAVAFALNYGHPVIDAVLVVAREGTLLAAILTDCFVRVLSHHAQRLDKFLF